MFHPRTNWTTIEAVNVLLIAGPASSALDEARVITNRSSGHTGVVIAQALLEHSLNTTLWFGQDLSYPLPSELNPSARFGTVTDLENLLSDNDITPFDAILLPAALPDYQLSKAYGPDGRGLNPHKWSGSLSKIHLELSPGPRILPNLRRMAPHAQIIGWKWEADGSMEDLMTIARKQIRDCQTDACVLNGPAYGMGHLLVPVRGEPIPCTSSTELGEALVQYLRQSHSTSLRE